MVERYHSGVIGCFIWDLEEMSKRRTNGTSWIRITEMSLGVSFETCLRHCEDALMGRRCYVLLRRHHNVPVKRCGDVPLRCLGDVSSRRRWVFHLRRTCDVAWTYRETSLRRRHDVLLPGRKLVYGKEINILTTKQTLQRLPLAFAQVKPGNTSENLLNEIRKIIYSLYRTK